jgi:protein-disulfide isomerase
MRRFLKSICFLMPLAALLGAAQTPTLQQRPAKPATDDAASLPSESTVDSFLQQTFGYEPDVSWKISSIKPAGTAGLAEVTVVLANPQGQQLSRFYVTPDGKHAITGDIIPFGAKPFEPANNILSQGITGPERGPKGSPVTIVEFGDLQCPACKAAQPTIQQLADAEPDAKFVFQNFPLEMHNWAFKGAEYADCVGHASNDAFWKFIAKVYDSQTEITAENVDEKLTAIADASGVKGSEIAACTSKPETRAHIEASIELGKKVDVTGTPTLFINGRKISNLDPHMLDVYKSLAAFAAKQSK